MGSRRARGINDVTGYPFIPYTRMSQDSKGKSIGVERQNWEIRGTAEEEGIPLYDGLTITDNDMSAAYDALERPGWSHVMKLVATGRFRGIAVFDADRAARDGWLGESLVKIVRDMGLKGFTVWSPVRSFDLSTRPGVSNWRRAIDAAEEEVFLIRRRTQIALKHKAMKGELTGGQKRTFGFLDRPKNVHEPVEAAAIRKASEDLLDGVGMPALLDAWEEAGIVSINGLPFTHSKLRDVLRRPMNAGIITASGKERGRLPGDPIVDEEVYRAVVAHFASINPGRPPYREYLMSRLGILVCDDCGSRMHGGRASRNADHTYICSYNPNRPRRRGCKRTAQIAGVDNAVREKTVAWWGDPERAQRDHLFTVQTDARDQKTHDRIAVIEDRLVALTSKLELPPERYEQAVQALTERRDRLRAQLTHDRTPAVLERVTAERAEEMWNSSLKSRREMIKAAIKTIRVKAHESPKGKVNSFNPERLVWEIW